MQLIIMQESELLFQYAEAILFGMAIAGTYGYFGSTYNDYKRYFTKFKHILKRYKQDNAEYSR